MTMRSCVECGELSERAHCDEHRPTQHKPSAVARGYDAAWDRLSRKARKLQPFCSDCGATDDLQADHTPQAWARKAAGKAIRLRDIDVVCGPCNRRRGAARGHTATRGHAPTSSLADPVGKAEFESEVA